MSSSVLTLILAGGEGERLSILSQVRAKPGVPFGGKYRIIDFALSNAVNSGLTDVGILTQYAPRSLIDHIGVGRPWDLDRSRGGVALLQPFIGRGRAHDWYRGTADAVLQNTGWRYVRQRWTLEGTTLPTGDFEDLSHSPGSRPPSSLGSYGLCA